jgi:hypothetical protein
MKFTSCGAAGQYHVFCLMENGGILHARRDQNGAWSPWEFVGEACIYNEFSCAAVGNDIHIVAVAGGALYHNILKANGQWQGFQGVQPQPAYP